MTGAAATLALLVLRASDLDLTRKFYEALGLSFTLEQHGPGPRYYSTKLGDTVLEIYPLASPPTAFRFGLCIADVDGAVEAIRAMGGTIVRVELGAPLRRAVVRDPDGNSVELSSRD